jgi:signal-transduction protein with cAMP-binding, CBS, and nucleotidyltransferase domain
MTIATLCVRDVDVVDQNETVWQAAIRMRQRAVGTLVVVNKARQPIGIVTDRDLMERVMAEGRDARNTLVRMVMTRDPATIGEDESLREALPLMRREGCRRLVVVDRAGVLVGLLSMDDVLMLVANQMEQVGQLIRRETPQGVAEEPVWSRWD